jgi:hypothetical protein
MFKSKSPEEVAAKEAQRERQAAERETQRQRQQAEKERQRYLSTPVGQAEVAFNNGDHVFQYAHDVASQQAVIVAMVGSTTTKQTADPTAILNAVCNQGWELVNGSFVFVEEGSQSRDKFLASGQNVAVKGTTVGYYLFRRCEANRRA